MKEKAWTYFGITILTFGLCTYLLWNGSIERSMIVFSLAIFIALALVLLLGLLKKWAYVQSAVIALTVVAVIWRFGSDMLPVAAVLITDLAERIAGRRMFMILSAVIVVLLAMITVPSPLMIMITAFILPVTFIMIYILNRWDDTRNILEAKNEDLNELRKKNMDQRKFAQTAEYTAGLRERNRLASRIHDKVGHGISGSIILLEGASAIIEKNPEKSKDTIDQVTENLREAVDDIRASLREERSTGAEAGLSEIKAELSKLSYEHGNIETDLETHGDTDQISSTIWICLYENLKEAISNLLKHSDATKFNVLITNQDKLIRAEYRDNGHVEDFKTDIGLQTMEERCAMMGGRCFFSGGNGFKIVMTFKSDQ